MTWSIVALRTWLSLQIDAWLQTVFAGDSLPAYEVNEQTLDLLSELKHCNERQENYNQLIIHDMRLKADEYRAEGIVHALFACCQSWKRCSVIFQCFLLMRVTDIGLVLPDLYVSCSECLASD